MLTNVLPHSPTVIGLVIGADLTAQAVRTLLTPLPAFILVNPAPCLSDTPDLLIQDDYPSALSSPYHCSSIRIASTLIPYQIVQTLRTNTKGYLYLGDSLLERLPQAVKDVLAGGTYLSPSVSSALEDYRYYEPYCQRLTLYHRQVIAHMTHYHPAGQIASELGRTLQAIYQVQRYLRDQFDADNNGALLDRLAALGIVQRQWLPACSHPASDHISGY
jgi:hypothetical protein